MSEEWDDIVCLPIIDISNVPNNNDVHQSIEQDSIDFINYQQLISYFYSIDLEPQNQTIIYFGKKCNFLMKILRYIIFWKNYELKPHHVAEGNRIIRIAGQSFDNRNKFHIRCLYTIFAKLTGNVISALKRFGQHWEEIGFQGSDPSTDFRGVGILGLFQLTFFVITPKVCQLSKEIYNLSLDQIQHYPFAITSMNITQIILQMLRDGSLNHFINESDSVLNIFNQFYFGTFLYFHKIWKNDKKTIMDIGFVLKDLRHYVRNNLKKILNDLVDYQTMDPDKTIDQQENFTNIININHLDVYN
ncbi:ELMO domain-containing protein 3-like [Dermatophagoides pteronyssinus]|uniref:ELMO domain-containing protein 3-like n=1 Tax=Dermatophagoides pteronyssinus TaxID=6956 RepID=UPI003F6735F4